MKTITPQETQLSHLICKGYVAFGILPNGQLCGVHRLIYHWTMHLGIGPDGCTQGRYCFESLGLALGTLVNWDGEGDPIGWHKHYPTRRCASFHQIRCRDIETGEICRDGDKSPRDQRQHAAATIARASAPLPV